MAQSYESQHQSGIGSFFRNFLSNLGSRAQANFSSYMPSNVRQDFSSSPLRTGGRVAGAVLNPVGTAVNELGRSGLQAGRQALDQNAYNAYMNEMLQNDPGYVAGSPSPSGGGSNYGGGYSPAGGAPSSYLTGHFPSSQPTTGGPLVNLNYGQNQQQVQMAGVGLPGITGPNIYGGSSTSSHSHGSTLGVNGGLGSGAHSISMSQLENMLSSGRGRGEHIAMPRHEIGEERSDARALGQTLLEYRNSLGK